MKLEISLKTGHQFDQHLLAGLADLISAHHFNKTFSGRSGDYFELVFVLEKESPAKCLENLAHTVAEIESSYPEMGEVAVHVRDVINSEPVLGKGKNGKPFSPVKGIRIVPWTSRDSFKPALHDILLDSADVFGTGLHPSTNLCLQLLKRVMDSRAEKMQTFHSVLDIGCGSGILTLSALRLGASHAVGLEINQNAVQKARRNIALNRLENSARILEASWQNIADHYDLVMANLVPSVLYKAAPCMKKLLRRNGMFITAGFPAASNKKVLRLLEKNGLRFVNESTLSGWGALLLSRQN